jgi:hypothetical protein
MIRLSSARWILLLALGASVPALSNCTEEVIEPVPVVEPTWSVVANELEAALLSVSGASADDVWAVGADAGKGGLLLHYDGAAWTRVPSGQAYDLWWVQVLARDKIFIGGAGATILIGDGKTFTRQATPGLAADTVFGVWASAPDDAWAVGGRAGRYGFLWHYDGIAWTNQELPDDVPLAADGELPALFKVWGRAKDDVYAVGGHGTILHYDGSKWRVIPTEVQDTLFTVAGDEDEIVIVGGDNQGVILDGAGKRVGPTDAPLLQGVTRAADGTFWASGANGVVYSRKPGAVWALVDTKLEVKPASLHAAWADPDGGVWAVGGQVLSAALDKGVMFNLGEPPATLGALPPDPTPPAVCPEGRADIAPTGSISRRWNELLLDSIRRDIPKPGLHARNLYHVSVAMYDAWAAYDEVADGVVFHERIDATDIDADRETAISFAAYRVLHHRYASASGGPVSLACYDDFMGLLGLDAGDTHTDGDDPVAVGNRVAAAVIDGFLNDGANEANGYADTTGYTPANPPLVVDRPGVTLTEPDRWQELNLAQAETQNGLIVDSGVQKYIGPNWGHVTPFALPPDPDGDGVHHEVALVPSVSMTEMRDWVVEMIDKAARLDPDSGATIDISPGKFGNNPLGTNDGTGHPENPATGAPYAANVVPEGDFTRVLAEFWADGPKSETPPGHWNVLANQVSDAPETELRPWGEATTVDRLEWDTKLYLALNGAVHDAAITAWGLKRKHTTARPISLVRYFAQKGQSSDPSLPHYDPEGLPLIDGLIEIVTDESSAPGQRHHHLRWFKDEIVVRSWLGEPGDRKNEVGHVGWMRAVDWIPYQRRTFVTPAFPGLVSGHSTFSRAAAEVLTAYTGSAFFPGGLGEFVAKEGEYLVFEDGPQNDVRLQWGTYYDAADQAGQSRLWGGIHIWPDDSQGRELGSLVGVDAAAHARTYFEGTAVP